MTDIGVAALPPLTTAVLDLGSSLSSTDWDRPSACSGWTVHDVFVHLTCTIREITDPASLPAPVAGSIERTNDVAVAAFRQQRPEETLEQYQKMTEPMLAQLHALQDATAASEIVDFDDAGTYPAHLIADSLVFDHHCHLRYDLGGAGPLTYDNDADSTVMRSTLDWLITGLPQMSPDRLAHVLSAPVALELTGPGGGTWTLRPASARIEVSTGEDPKAAARISSTAEHFLLWGTHRRSWLDLDVTVDGDQRLGTAVTSAIKVF